MKLILSALIRVAAFFTLAAFLLGVPVPAQEAVSTDEDTSPQLPPTEVNDTPFQESAESDDAGVAWPGEEVYVEIELSPEGVVAFDSVGNRWYFDFDDDVFLLDPRAGGDERVGPSEETGADELEAVEDRCTELKIVRQPALKAVFVGYDEFVENDITAYDRVTVKGWVKGDIQSYNKRVLVTASGRVDGDIKAPDIEVKEGGQVLGEQIITEAYQIPPIDFVIAPFSSEGIWIVFIFTLGYMLIAFLAVSLAPRQLKNISRCIVEHRYKTYFTGLLFIFLLPLLFAVLAVSIVGVLAIPLVLFSIPIAMVLGMSVCGTMLGRSVFKKVFGQHQSQMFQSLFGVLVFMLVWAVVALLLGSGDYDGVIHGLGIFMLVIAILVTTFPLLAGVGAVVLTRFGFKRYVSYKDQVTEPEAAVPTPAPPPLSGRIPNGPPLKAPPRPPSFGGRPEPPHTSSGE